MSLIELVFAIVIIGIAAMSFPLILTQTSNNIKMALQQEAILNAKSYLGIILSYPWDDNAVSAQNIAGGRVMVLSTDAATSADSEFNTVAVNGISQRVGHIQGQGASRRAMLTSINGALNATAAASNINGFDNNIQNLAVTPTDLDYILNFSLTPTISFVSDATDYSATTIAFSFSINGNAAAVTNIKMVEMQASNPPANDINIVLRAYSSNIGEFVLASRTYI